MSNLENGNAIETRRGMDEFPMSAGSSADQEVGHAETDAVRPPRFAIWVLLIATGAILGLVAWKQTRTYDRPAAPESAYIRQAPVFQLHDQAMKLVRLQRYIGRQKFLVAFVNASAGAERSAVATSIRERWTDFERSGGVVLVVTAARPAENREAIERGRLPFALLSDLNNFEVHREWGAFDERADAPREAVIVVDRAGLIRFVHLEPDDLGLPDVWVKELRMVR